jgi:uncharacterized protein (DUF2147 family)
VTTSNIKPIQSKRLLLGLTLLVCITNFALSGPAQAADSPLGTWRTIDDSSGKARSIIKLEINSNILSGRVEKSLDPKDKPDAACTKCTDSRKDQQIIGMVILSGLKQSANEPNTCEGGEILDPDSGTIYKARLKLKDNNELELRGFVGISLFGRTQIWKREP